MVITYETSTYIILRSIWTSLEFSGNTTVCPQPGKRTFFCRHTVDLQSIGKDLTHSHHNDPIYIQYLLLNLANVAMLEVEIVGVHLPFSDLDVSSSSELLTSCPWSPASTVASSAGTNGCSLWKKTFEILKTERCRCVSNCSGFPKILSL